MFYPNPPKMSDLEIISLSITSECLGKDSKKPFIFKIQKDYSSPIPNLIHRTRNNARRKSLRDWILYCTDIWSEKLSSGKNEFIVDSIPIPVCKVCQALRSIVCRKSVDQVKPIQGFDSTIR